MDRQKLLEWAGVATAILYSILIALNIGVEFIGFSLLLVSAFLIGLWAYFGHVLRARSEPKLALSCPNLISFGRCCDERLAPPRAAGAARARAGLPEAARGD